MMHMLWMEAMMIMLTYDDDDDDNDNDSDDLLFCYNLHTLWATF